MKYYWFIPVFAVTVIATQFFIGEDTTAYENQKKAKLIQLEVNEKVAGKNTKRVGLNLGAWSSWGAEQLCSNILMNPGFESGTDRIITVVTDYTEKSFSDERGLGAKDGYWKGATYDIRTGESAGNQGQIVSSIEMGPDGLPQYVTEEPLPPIKEKSVITLTKDNHKRTSIGCWWIPLASKGLVVTDPKEKRPGSAGKQSAMLSPEDGKAVQLQYYLDAIGSRAGKLLVVDGKWHLSLWAKGDNDQNVLAVEFLRLNEGAPFFSQEIKLTKDWKEYSFDFDAKDEGAAALLKFGMTAKGPNASKIWVDDIYLGSADDVKSVFRKEVVQALRKLNPGYLRDYQGQLGDTIKNRLAPTYARGPFKYRIAGSQPRWAFGYSIPEFLDLCELIGANPWISIPSVISDEEAAEFGKWLGVNAPKERFSEVFVEFGNENWNWAYRSTGIPYPQVCGKTADRAFELLKKTSDDRVNLKCVIQGNFKTPNEAIAFGFNAEHADILAVAPYFFEGLDEGDINAGIKKAFSDQIKPLEVIAEDTHKMDSQFAFYGVNFHTVSGTASAEDRNKIVAGVVSASALARRLNQGVMTQASPMMVYTFAGFDTHLEDRDEYVRLSGVMRDLSPTNRFRPIGLAMAMINRATGGSLHPLQAKEGSEALPLSMAGFKSSKQWKAVIASQSEEPFEVALEFPDDGRELPNQLLYLDYESYLDTNEDAEKVKIARKGVEAKGRVVTFEIQPYGLVVLTSEEYEDAAPEAHNDQEHSGEAS